MAKIISSLRNNNSNNIAQPSGGKTVDDKVAVVICAGLSGLLTGKHGGVSENSSASDAIKEMIKAADSNDDKTLFGMIKSIKETITNDTSGLKAIGTHVAEITQAIKDFKSASSNNTAAATGNNNTPQNKLDVTVTNAKDLVPVIKELESLYKKVGNNTQKLDNNIFRAVIDLTYLVKELNDVEFGDLKKVRKNIKKLETVITDDFVNLVKKIDESAKDVKANERQIAVVINGIRGMIRITKEISLITLFVPFANLGILGLSEVLWLMNKLIIRKIKGYVAEYNAASAAMQGLAKLILSATGALLLAGLAMKIINTGDIIAFGTILMVFVTGLLFLFTIVAPKRKIQLATQTAGALGQLLLYSTLALAIGGLFMMIPGLAMNAIKFGGILLGFVSVLLIALGIASRISGGKELKIAQGLTKLVKTSTLALIIGGAIFYIPGMAENVMKFAIILGLFVSAIALALGGGSGLAGGSLLKSAIGLSILVVVCAGVLVGAAFLMQQEGITENIIKFAIILGLFITGLCIVFGVANHFMKDNLKATIGIAIIVITCGGVLLAAALILKDNPNAIIGIAVFTLCLLVLVIGVTFALKKLNDLKVTDFRSLALKIVALEAVILATGLIMAACIWIISKTTSDPEMIKAAGLVIVEGVLAVLAITYAMNMLVKTKAENSDWIRAGLIIAAAEGLVLLLAGVMTAAIWMINSVVHTVEEAKLAGLVITEGLLAVLAICGGAWLIAKSKVNEGDILKAEGLILAAEVILGALGVVLEPMLELTNEIGTPEKAKFMGDIIKNGLLAVAAVLGGAWIVGKFAKDKVQILAAEVLILGAEGLLWALGEALDPMVTVTNKLGTKEKANLMSDIMWNALLAVGVVLLGAGILGAIIAVTGLVGAAFLAAGEAAIWSATALLEDIGEAMIPMVNLTNQIKTKERAELMADIVKASFDSIKVVLEQAGEIGLTKFIGVMAGAKAIKDASEVIPHMVVAMNYLIKLKNVVGNTDISTVKPIVEQMFDIIEIIINKVKDLGSFFGDFFTGFDNGIDRIKSIQPVAEALCGVFTTLNKLVPLVKPVSSLDFKVIDTIIDSMDKVAEKLEDFADDHDTQKIVGVAKTVKGMSEALSETSQMISNLAVLKIPIYNGVDANGNAIISGYMNLTDESFSTALTNIGKIINCIPSAIIEAFSQEGAKEAFGIGSFGEFASLFGSNYETPAEKALKLITKSIDPLTSLGKLISLYAGNTVPEIDENGKPTGQIIQLNVAAGVKNMKDIITGVLDVISYMVTKVAELYTIGGITVMNKSFWIKNSMGMEMPRPLSISLDLLTNLFKSSNELAKVFKENSVNYDSFAIYSEGKDSKIAKMAKDIMITFESVANTLINKWQNFSQLTEAEVFKSDEGMEAVTNKLKKLVLSISSVFDDVLVLGNKINDQTYSIEEQYNKLGTVIGILTNISEEMNKVHYEGNFETFIAGLKRVYEVIASIKVGQNLAGFQAETELLERYVKAVNTIKIENIDKLTGLVNGLNKLAAKMGSLDKLTEAISERLSIVLAELTAELKHAETTIENAKKLQTERHKLINDSMNKVKDIMAKKIEVEISAVASGGGGGDSGGSGGGATTTASPAGQTTAAGTSNGDGSKTPNTAAGTPSNNLRSGGWGDEGASNFNPSYTPGNAGVTASTRTSTGALSLSHSNRSGNSWGS